jgi:uncharacterized protein (AIM24 family)
MKSQLFGSHVETQGEGAFMLQNERMLKIALQGRIMARQGAMVAYQGDIDFEYQGGGLGRFLKKAVTGEGTPLMKCTGNGDLFLAKNAEEIHVVRLENEAISVSGEHLLAFEDGLDWDIKRVEGVSMFSGSGLFNTMISGTGWVALTSEGTPVVLKTDAPTFVDAQAIVAWSQGLGVSVKSSFKAGALIGRGSGEMFQMAFTGQGFVIVQPSEGAVVPPHSH